MLGMYQGAPQSAFELLHGEPLAALLRLFGKERATSLRVSHGSFSGRATPRAPELPLDAAAESAGGVLQNYARANFRDGLGVVPAGLGWAS